MSLFDHLTFRKPSLLCAPSDESPADYISKPNRAIAKILSLGNGNWRVITNGTAALTAACSPAVTDVQASVDVKARHEQTCCDARIRGSAVIQGSEVA